ncbi:MAG TPA: hypothetical protein VGJ75_22210 [Dongiaceae bacterium]|jgi:hypothetical protein
MNSPVLPPPVQRRGAFEFAGKWRQRVCDLPETGMGYVVVSVELRDGRTFDQVVIDSGIASRVRGLPDVPFAEDDIVGITANHRKWDWKETP